MMKDNIQRLPVSAVDIHDGFWTPRLETNRLVTLNHQYDHIKANGCLDNFRRVLGEAGGEFEGPTFIDANLYKWLEAASYTLTKHDIPTLEEKVDEVISLVERAQSEDGYLFTYVMITNSDKRWANFSMMHELYCAGHLIEAAVTHAQATGETRLLNVGRRLADHIYETLGPEGKARIPGHQEIELALIRLYQITDKRQYLRLAEIFIERRGRSPSPLAKEFQESSVFERAALPIESTRDDFLADSGEYDGRFAQDHRPVRDQETIEGHAVRATNLYTAVAMLLQERDDPELFDAIERLWRNMVRRRMYVTGGIGSSADGESFTEDYDLPNDTPIAETCGAAGVVFWSQAMFELTGDAVYVNSLERTLYNALLVGVSLDGTRFFYNNPLETFNDHDRQEWFYVACCPPNVARILASFESYVYAKSEATKTLYVNLYVGSTAETELAKQSVQLEQSTEYPWEGSVSVEVSLDEPGEFALAFRRPSWAKGTSVRVNGRPVSPDDADGYAILRQTWKDGDTISLSFSMEVDLVTTHPEARNDAGFVAIRRGPLVYCLEEIDNAAPLRHLVLENPSSLTTRHEESLLDGVTVIEGDGVVQTQANWNKQLYQRVSDIETEPVSFNAIPYYAWNNREQGAMTCWLRLA